MLAVAQVAVFDMINNPSIRVGFEENLTEKSIPSLSW
jgi:hypothetical protein